MQRLRLYDLQTSRLPSLLGLCADNVPQLADAVNGAQQRLIYAKEAGDEGWWGTWAEIAFVASQAEPYVTMPRDIARIEAMNVCNVPVKVQNQFYEYLTFGNGRMPKTNPWLGVQWNIPNAFTRNNVVTFRDLSGAPQYLTVYITDPSDVGKHILLGGTDASGDIIRSLNVTVEVEGSWLALEAPSVTTPMTFSTITGIQKDITVGVVRIYQHDPDTGDEILLLTMQPSETTASYRRYYMNNLPPSCCAANFLFTAGCSSGCSTEPVQLRALAKLELIPVQVPTDYLLIQNKEAIIAECQAMRYSTMDSISARQLEGQNHQTAIRLLNGELAHYVGAKVPTVGFYPFGTSRLIRQKIGTLV